ncbi:MAG: aminopeptidase [Planctomycetota bacterium]
MKRVRVVIIALLLLPAGCEGEYFLQLALGELASLGNTVPVSEAIEDPRLTDDERAELVLTQEVRQFGVDQIGLVAGDAYTLFEWNGTEPAGYALAASEKDSLTSYLWNLPFIGPTEVRFYFEEWMARQEANRLAGLDYDVFLGQADGFSTLGFFPDPVRQSNLASMDEFDLAELILHEMTHSTVFKPTDANFNESLATYVGRAAALSWFEHKFGAGSDIAQAASDRFADKAVIDDFVNDLYARMTQYYADAAARGETREKIIAGREAEFDAARARYLTDFHPLLVDSERWAVIGEARFENATLLAGVRYQASLSDYEAVFDKLGGDFPAALAVFSEAAAQKDSRGYLRTWVQEH